MCSVNGVTAFLFLNLTLHFIFICALIVYGSIWLDETDITKLAPNITERHRNITHNQCIQTRILNIFLDKHV